MAPTDPGLDERVCRKLGWEPRVEWLISRDGGESSAISFGGEESVARAWLALKHSDGLYMDYARLLDGREWNQMPGVRR